MESICHGFPLQGGKPKLSKWIDKTRNESRNIFAEWPQRKEARKRTKEKTSSVTGSEESCFMTVWWEPSEARMPSKGITQGLAHPAEKGEVLVWEWEEAAENLEQGCGRENLHLQGQPPSYVGFRLESCKLTASDTTGQQGDGARKLMRVHGWEERVYWSLLFPTLQ